MSIFLVTPLADNAEKIRSILTSAIGEHDFFCLQNEAGFLVRFNGTTVELSNKIGVTGQAAGQPSETGSTLVTSLTTYYGRGPADMWEWLKTRFEGNA